MMTGVTPETRHIAEGFAYQIGSTTGGSAWVWWYRGETSERFNNKADAEISLQARRDRDREEAQPVQESQA